MLQTTYRSKHNLCVVNSDTAHNDFLSETTQWIAHNKHKATDILVHSNGMSTLVKQKHYASHGITKWLMVNQFIRMLERSMPSVYHTGRSVRSMKRRVQLLEKIMFIPDFKQVRLLFDEIIAFLPKRVYDVRAVSEYDMKFIIEEICNICKQGEQYLRHDVVKEKHTQEQQLLSGHQVHDRILLFMWYLCGIMEMHDERLLHVSHAYPQNNTYRTGVDALLYYVLHSHDKYEQGHRSGAYTDAPIDFSRLVLLIAMCVIASSNSAKLHELINKYVHLRKRIEQDNKHDTHKHETMCTCRICTNRYKNIQELTELSIQIKSYIPSQCKRVLEHIQCHVNKHDVNFSVYATFISMFSYMNYDAIEAHGCKIDISDSYHDIVSLRDSYDLERTLNNMKHNDTNKTKAVLQVSYRDFAGITMALAHHEPLLKRNKNYQFSWL